MRIITLLFLSVTISSYAQEEKNSFSLAEAQQYAAKNSYAKKIAEADLEIAGKKVSETMAIGFPKLSGKIDFQNFIDIPTQVIPAQAFNPNAPEGEFAAVQFGTQYTTNAGLTATQLIFDGSYFVGLKAAKMYSQLSQETLKKSDIDIKAQVTNAYYSVLVAQENVAVLDSSYGVLEEIYKETKAIFEAGLLEKQDADQMELNVLNIQNSLDRAKRQVELAYDLLKMQMGLSIEKPIELTDDLKTILEATETSELLEKDFSVTNHIEYKMVESGLELQELNLKNEKMAYLPSAGAFISHTQSAFRNEFDVFSNKPWYPTTIWGVNITVPIFDFGVQMAKTKQARLEVEKVQIQKTQVEQSLQIQAKSARNEYITAKSIYKNQERNLELAENIYQNTLIKYKEGLASSTELAQIQSQYFTTQANYVNAIFQLASAKTALDKALGNY